MVTTVVNDSIRKNISRAFCGSRDGSISTRIGMSISILQDRRWRAETIDVIGRCGVPRKLRTDSRFKFPRGQFDHWPGDESTSTASSPRITARRAFSIAALEERYGTARDCQSAISPTVRRRLWSPPRSPLAGLRGCLAAGSYPSAGAGLIEPAVNVDTTTRNQTAWQVKLSSNIATDVTCQTPFTEIANWPPGNFPSAARLTTATVAVTTEPDPCLVPPSGGYRGLENHLYRVEVHDVTSAGAVRVKWSRENAHVATQVVEILPGGAGLRVESLGRDDVLRFKTGDWVEITCDSREFSGLPGEMRKVTVEDSTQTMTFTGALPAAEFPEGVTDADNHRAHHSLGSVGHRAPARWYGAD